MSRQDDRVVLSVRVDPVLRDYVRQAAKAAHMELSAWVARALRQVMARESADRALEIARQRDECMTCGYCPCACDQY